MLNLNSLLFHYAHALVLTHYYIESKTKFEYLSHHVFEILAFCKKGDCASFESIKFVIMVFEETDAIIDKQTTFI